MAPAVDDSASDLTPISDGAVRRVAPTVELGLTGLKRVSGYVDEEFLPQLRGRKAVQVFREMSDNDAITGALLFALERLLREVDWRVEPASSSADDKAAAEFVEQCMNDMSQPWGELIGEILSMLAYGWSYHEIVYKKRVGPWESDPTKRSKYTDGKIGWRKIPIRSQETLLRWSFDKAGGVQAMVQLSPPTYQTTVLPITKCLLFRTTSAKGNPEGRSILRSSYRPWYLKKRLEEIEAVGVERDLAGLPVGKVPADYLNAKPGTAQAKMVEAFKQMVKSVRRDEQEGLLIPAEYDQDTKQPLFDFQLLSSGGSRQFDTNGIIQRYEQRQLMTVLADFILVGHENVGSYSLHTDKSGLFRTAINSFAQGIADVFNRHALPRLFALNGWKPAELPQIVPNDVDPPDLTQLGGFMQQMTAAGMQWFPDAELEKFIRKAARLPELDERTEAAREMETRQAEIMRIAQGRLEMLNIGMQAQQGQMGLQQQSMGIEQQKRELEAPQVDPNVAAQQDMDIKGAQAQQQMTQSDQMHQAKLAQLQQQSQSSAADAEQARKQRDAEHQATLKARDAESRFNLKARETEHKTGLKSKEAEAKAKLAGLTAAQKQKLAAEGERHKLTLAQLKARAADQAKAKKDAAKKAPAKKEPKK